MAFQHNRDLTSIIIVRDITYINHSSKREKITLKYRPNESVLKVNFLTFKAERLYFKLIHIILKLSVSTIKQYLSSE